MRAGALLLLSGCAWVTPSELAEHRGDCVCPPDGTPLYPDRDGDGWGETAGVSTCDQGEGWVEEPGDCDDTDPAVHPGTDELCGGGDEDCDGEVDEAGAVGELPWYPDDDGDGWGVAGDPVWACLPPSGTVGEGIEEDCDDARADVYPGAEEVCGDHADNGCDGAPEDCRLAGLVSWSESDQFITDEVLGDELGWALAGGADIAGDTRDDVVLGAPGWLGASGRGGAALVFSAPLDVEPPLTSADATVVVESGVADAGAGHAVALLANHAGDGATWLAVAVTPYDAEVWSAGAVYLLDSLGHPVLTLEDEAVTAVVDAPADAALGAALAAGDDDGDGLSDLLAGAPGEDESTGAVYLFGGPISRYGGVDQAVRIGGPDAGAWFGGSVALADLDGDGSAEILAGAPFTGQGTGAVLLAEGPASDSTWDAAGNHFAGEAVGDRLGTVASAGDTDGDGYGDALLGAYGADLGAGAAWLLPGGLTLPATLADAQAKVAGAAEGGALGFSVAGIGDFDADGFADVAIGAPVSDDPVPEAGLVLAFYGPLSGEHAAGDAPLRLQGAATLAWAGAALHSAGDPDGDGYDDLLLGAPGLGEVALLRGWGW